MLLSSVRWGITLFLGSLHLFVPCLAFDNDTTSDCPCIVAADEIGTEWIPIIYNVTVATEYIYVDPDTNKRSTSTKTNPSASAKYSSITESLASSLGSAWANYDPATEPQSKPTVTGVFRFYGADDVEVLTTPLVFPTEYLVVFALAVKQQTRTSNSDGSQVCVPDASQTVSETIFKTPSIYPTSLSPLMSTFENQGRAVHYLTGLPSEVYTTIPGLESCTGTGNGIPTTKAVVRRLTRRRTRTRRRRHPHKRTLVPNPQAYPVTEAHAQPEPTRDPQT